MKACFSPLLGLSLAFAPTTVAMAAPGGPSMLSMRTAPAADDPVVLYDEGKKAYRLGRFGEAVEKWEQAYAASERSLLLYNIALAYRGRYGISGDIEDLRKARAVMKNFFIIAQADPEIDPDDAEARIAEIDELLVEAEAAAAANKEVKRDDQPPPPPHDPPPATPEGPDPGRNLRIAGAATLGTGGLMLVTGTVLGIYFGVRGQEFSDELRQLQAERPDVCIDPDSIECTEQDLAIDNARNNGRSANLGVGLSFGIGGGLGAVALGAGVILFLRGNRQTAEWKQSVAGSLRLVPNGRGLALRGRF